MIHYFSAELKTKIDVISRGCFKSDLVGGIAYHLNILLQCTCIGPTLSSSTYVHVHIVHKHNAYLQLIMLLTLTALSYFV